MKYYISISFAHILLLLRCIVTSSLSSKAREERGTAQDSNLFDSRFEDIFERRWMPDINFETHAKNAKTPQDAIKIVQEQSRRIGKQMGVPDMPHEPHSLGDGTVEGTKAAAKKLFSGFHGMQDIIHYGIDKLGVASKRVDTAEALEHFSMVANRMGQRSLASQMAPLIHASTQPNPNSMFNLIGSIMAQSNMPQESVNFMQRLAGMYSGNKVPTREEFSLLQNFTMARLKNRTLSTMPYIENTGKKNGKDYYKKTASLLIISYQLPCSWGARVCFHLTNEFFIFKIGPGYFKGGAWATGPPGTFAMALGIASQTQYSFISSPFYYWPTKAAGIENDFKLNRETIELNYVPQTEIHAALKLRESSDCLGTGKGKPHNPRHEFCPFMVFRLTGGDPQFWVDLTMCPVRNVKRDTVMTMWDFANMGGPVGKDMMTEWLPEWAFLGFYRAY